MKLIMICGAYRGDIDKNIAHAREAAIRLWQAGYAVFCPHMNTAHFDGYCHDGVWLEGAQEILKRCDAIYVLDNWQTSEGTKAEIELAQSLNKEIYYEEIDKFRMVINASD